MNRSVECAPPSAGPIDCHAHVFTTDLPVVADARYRPTADAPLAAYLAVLAASDVAGGVLVQPSFLGTDNTFLLDAIAKIGPALRGVAVVDPSWSPSALAELYAAGVRGVRFNLIGRPIPRFDGGADRALVERIVAAGLHVEVHLEGAAWSEVLPPLMACGATVVIDHFGRPQSSDPLDCPGFRAVLDALRSPHVWAKLSAPYRVRADAAAAARAILSAAGPDRLLWGSDWPWTQHPEITSYPGQLAQLRRAVPDDRIRRQILEVNARRLYWR